MIPLLAALVAAPPPPPDSAREARLAASVEIVRTEYGVPHVYAPDLRAMGFALGWLQMEDYGEVVPRALVQARGMWGAVMGRDSLGGAFDARRRWMRAAEALPHLDPDTRAVYAGFADGVNHFLRLHRGDAPPWAVPDFTAVDVLARDVQSWSRGDARAFVRSRVPAGSGSEPAAAHPDADPDGGPDGSDAHPDAAFALDGSNAWALAPSRIATGHAVLLRNPHLRWDAGYYEAHVVVPGVLEFYGDFRIGGPFGIIGGFNRDLGWATTNNYPRLSQVYALEAAPGDPEGYLFDDAPLPLRHETVTVPYRAGDGVLRDTSEVTMWTVAGPVIHREADRIYVLKDPRDGEYRRGEQFLRMMRAGTLHEWLEVMRMRAHPTSNFTYADARGHIAHLYNARLPHLPHPPTGDTAAVARGAGDVWQHLVPFEALPFYLDPPGGYVQQANDTPDYTNLNVPLDRDTVPSNLPARRLRLRSQLSLAMVHGTGTLTLEDVIRRKHTPRMLLAERLADELVAILRATDAGASPGADEPGADAPSTGTEERGPDGWSRAVDALDRWDRTAGADSRGGVLFAAWWDAYLARLGGDEPFTWPWSPLAPTSTPRGIARPDVARVAFGDALATLDSAGVDPAARWGDVHRVVRGTVDEPVSGCPPTLGCFRALSFEDLPDGRRAANRGDGWVLLVEFGRVPRGWSILAYGESRREDSPHFDDQARLFAEGRMKPLRWTRQDVLAHAERRYHPGR